MRNHLAHKHRAKMTRLEFIMMAAGPSVALVAVFIRLTGTG